ncbi:MAG TPA: PPC domain-containing protein [Longimicrobiaceae bacterium]|nr:PPC domain-containing protein [Longimicrobiaceae bacterium]
MQPVRTSIALAPLALLLCSAAAGAQTPIRVGQTVEGRLTTESRKAPEDQSFYDLYTFTGRRGERVRFTLRSKDFDAYLNVGRTDKSGGFESLDTDDDGAGGTDARVELTLPADGAYAIRATTLNAGDSGAYTLQVEQGVAPAPPVLRPITVGQTVSGDLGGSDPKLDDNSFYDLYTFQARAGDGVTATLRSSEFDAFLVLGRMRGEEFEEIDSDDDNGGGSDARVSATLSEAGTYTLRANSLRGDQTGAYTLELASGGVADAEGGDEEHDHGPAAARPLDPNARPIRAGQTVRDSLTARDPEDSDGTYYRDWLYTGRAGERIVVTLRSTAFDSYLQFGKTQAGTFTYMDAQDDRGGGNDSLLAVALPEDGQYVLRVNTISKATGPYSLMLERLRGR